MGPSALARGFVVVALLLSQEAGARRAGGPRRGKTGKWTAGTKRSVWHECQDYVEDTEHDCFPLCVRDAAFECITAAHQAGGGLRADPQIYRNFDGNSLSCEAGGQRGTLEIGTKNDRSAFHLRWKGHNFAGKWVMHWDSVAEHHPHSDEQWCCAAVAANSTDAASSEEAIPRRGDLTLHFESFQPAVLEANERKPIQKMHTMDAGTSFGQTGGPHGLSCRGDSGWEPFMPLWLADSAELNTLLRSCLFAMDFSQCYPTDQMRLKNLWDEPVPERLTDAVKGGYRLVDGRLSGDIEQDQASCFYPWNSSSVVNGRAPVDDWSGRHQTGLREGHQAGSSHIEGEEAVGGETETQQSEG